MAVKKIKHAPSAYRALVREAKSASGRHPGLLLEAARRIEDPYFVSLALFTLSSDERLDLSEAASVAEEAVRSAGAVEQLWRRAELFEALARYAQSWRGEEAMDIRERLMNTIVKGIISMPDGKGLSDAIVACASRVGCKRLITLLSKAVTNRGFAFQNAKAILRQWSKKCSDSELGPTPGEILEVLESIHDAFLRSRIMGYLHLQCKRSQCLSWSYRAFEAAVEAVEGLEEEQRLEALRYLSMQASTENELMLLGGTLELLEEPVSKASLMTALGGVADKSGFRGMAVQWFQQAMHVCSGIDDAVKQTRIKLNVAKGLEGCGEDALADKLREEAVSVRWAVKPEHADTEVGEKSVVTETEISTDDRADAQADAQTDELHPRRHVLALYNTYEGGLKPVHFRAIARAAPLCYAFDLDLALLGFPSDDLAGLIEQAITETNIGKGGKYLRDLLAQEHVVLVPCTRSQPPEDWSGLGLPFATTSHPDRKKQVTMNEARQIAKGKHPLGRLCLVMGLGKKGLPKALLKMADLHLELTGKNIPLETCTAMGVLARQMKELG